MLKLDRVFFALGLIGLGVLSFVYADFALQWQPVPAWIPGRAYLAYASGALMVVAGGGLLSRRTSRLSSGVLLVYLLLWLLLLKLPQVVMAPLVEGNWLGFGEIAVIVAAGLVLFSTDRGQSESSNLKFATGKSGLRIARFLFAFALIPIGLSHSYTPLRQSASCQLGFRSVPPGHISAAPDISPRDSASFSASFRISPRSWRLG